MPSEAVSVAVALADKLDTLTGFWAIDEKPTGSKDPFALRRAALGVIRLVLENDVRTSISNELKQAFARVFLIFAKQGKLAYLNFYEVDENDDNELSVDDWSLFRRQYSEEEVQEGADPEAWINLNDGVSLEIIKNNHLAWAQDVEFEAGSRGEAENAFINSEQNIFTIDSRASDLLSFFHDRLKVFLRDQGIRHDVIDACIAMDGSDDLTLLVKRARALEDFMTSDDGGNLLQGFKRANNILTQAEAKDGVEYSYGGDVKFAEEPAEIALFEALALSEGAISSAVETEDFAAAMGSMAALRAPIDAFFEAVQVNSNNQVVRRNRLNLLHQIRQVCGQVADFTRIEG